MAYLYLTNSFEKILINDEDKERCLNHSWHKVTNDSGSAIITSDINGITTSLGRYILNYNGPLDIDHRDRNYLNNQKNNLRIATRQQNLANQPYYINNTSGYKGVTWHKKSKKWYAQIKVNRQHIHLGTFHDIKLAAKAYNDAAVKYFGEFAWLNKID